MQTYFVNLNIDGAPKAVLYLEPDNQAEIDALAKVIEHDATLHTVDDGDRPCCHVCICPVNDELGKLIKSKMNPPASPQDLPG